MRDKKNPEPIEKDQEIGVEWLEVTRRDFRVPILDRQRDQAQVKGLSCELQDISEGGLSLVVFEGSPGPVGTAHEIRLNLEGVTIDLQGRLSHIGLRTSADRPEENVLVCGIMIDSGKNDMLRQYRALVGLRRQEYLERS
ncbi:MAG: PilZ domain-containing protein [Deltaproteobacteria bacterium]|nr:PilZ domain-containing protein [Deltaproteobacteria bacterium]